MSFLSSVLAIIFSSIALYTCCPFLCKCSIDIDYVGIIIGSLSLLTAVLIGWNIYTVIDFKENSKKINFIVKQSKINKKEYESQLNKSLSISYYSSYLCFLNSKEYAGAITALICSIRYLIEDVKGNYQVENFEQQSTKLNQLLSLLTDCKYNFGENNTRIIKDNIKYIKSHKNWWIIKGMFDNCFLNICNIINKEKDPKK